MPVSHDDPLMRTAHEICCWHHERWDGRGYPDGLRGDEIPVSAQVVALADVYDALTSDRCYKKAFFARNGHADDLKRRVRRIQPAAAGMLLRRRSHAARKFAARAERIRLPARIPPPFGRDARAAFAADRQPRIAAFAACACKRCVFSPNRAAVSNSSTTAG